MLFMSKIFQQKKITQTHFCLYQTLLNGCSSSFKCRLSDGLREGGWYNKAQRERHENYKNGC